MDSSKKSIYSLLDKDSGHHGRTCISHINHSKNIAGKQMLCGSVVPQKQVQHTLLEKLLRIWDVGQEKTPRFGFAHFGVQMIAMVNHLELNRKRPIIACYSMCSNLEKHV